MMRPAVFFDLDGTIVDASDRLYRLFQSIVPQSSLSKREYWALKRSGVSNKAILAEYYQEVPFATFEAEWFGLIESPQYLALDRLYDGAVELLNLIGKHWVPVLLTARHSRKNLIDELNQLGISSLFAEILVASSGVGKAHVAQEWLVDRRDLIPADCAIVGDTEADILAGREIGLKTIAVTYGFAGEERLVQLHPNHMVSDIGGMLTILSSKGKNKAWFA